MERATEKGIPALFLGKAGAAEMFFCVVKLAKCLVSCERPGEGTFNHLGGCKFRSAHHGQGRANVQAMVFLLPLG